MGGAMAYYRHFVERRDFELFVATDDPNVMQYSPPYPLVLFQQPAWLERMCRTRLSLWMHSYKHLVAGNFIPAKVLKAAEAFKPDFIFTIAGAWGWTTLMAQKLAQRLKVPLVGSFNDWFDFSGIIHPVMRPMLERKFRSFYQSCDLAWCTCEGMREELGPHRNAQILYPLGGQLKPVEAKPATGGAGKSRFVAAFAGNLGNWYGKMLEQLVTKSLAVDAPIEFRIFGGNTSWSKAFEQMATAKGIFRGHLPFDQLRQEMAEVDGLLLLMGFGEDCALTERTSFKTKFLDYLSFQKPILLWGPEYCSAVRYAKEFDSAETCTSPDPALFLKQIIRLAGDTERGRALAANGQKMYEDRFHPDRIHAQFLTHSLRLMGCR